MDTKKPLITGINVIAIYVTDLEAAKDFYLNKLGLKEKHASPPGISLQAGEMLIYLEGKREGRESPHLKYPTTSIVFQTDSVKNAYDRLVELEVPAVQEYVVYGDEFAMFRITDPDGNVIEFSGKP